MHEPTPQVAAAPAGDAPPAGFFGPPPCRLSTQATVPPAPSRTTRAATPNRTATIGRRLRSGTGDSGPPAGSGPGTPPAGRRTTRARQSTAAVGPEPGTAPTGPTAATTTRAAAPMDRAAAIPVPAAVVAATTAALADLVAPGPPRHRPATAPTVAEARAARGPAAASPGTRSTSGKGYPVHVARRRAHRQRVVQHRLPQLRPGGSGLPRAVGRRRPAAPRLHRRAGQAPDRHVGGGARVRPVGPRPNGFFRGFKAGSPGTQPDVKSSYDERNGRIALEIRNPGAERTQVAVRDGYTSQETKLTLEPGEAQTKHWSLSRTRGWYDLVITVQGDLRFQYRYAGHLENGEDSISDPAMGGLL